MSCQLESLGEQGNVEAEMTGYIVDPLLLNAQEIHQKGSYPPTDQIPGNGPVARALPPTPATVGKEDNTPCINWHRPVCDQGIAIAQDGDMSRSGEFLQDARISRVILSVVHRERITPVSRSLNW